MGAASCLVSASPTAPLAQEDAKSSRPAVRDVSEELSRQLEDILNTYCVDASQEGPGEDGGQSEPAEQEEAEKCRSESPRNGEQEPGGPEMNGEKEGTKGTEEFRAGEECGERDQKKAQEKKKAKGLGKSCPAVVVPPAREACSRGGFCAVLTALSTASTSGVGCAAGFGSGTASPCGVGANQRAAKVLTGAGCCSSLGVLHVSPLSAQPCGASLL